MEILIITFMQLNKLFPIGIFNKLEKNLMLNILEFMIKTLME